METENTVYPISRYWRSDNFRFYYAYGNTPSQDFLQNCSHSANPTILVLGCGDIRSCLYSLWKNFDVEEEARFDGVHFVLNDVSAAVLARNILFLHVCINLPQEENELKKCLCGLWAIWYCHELYPEHQKLLNSSLRDLCKYSKNWCGEANPLYPLVKFTSPGTLREVAKIWKMWLRREIKVTSVEEMHLSRKAHILKCDDLRQIDSHSSAFAEDVSELPYESQPFSTKCEAQKSEVLSYMSGGSAYAERVVKLHLPVTTTLVNFTLFEREDGLYNLHYRSLPFRCYYHSVNFSSSNLGTAFSHQLPVAEKFFKLWPLLANSVQQFSLWIQSAHKVLKSEKKDNICFIFDCSHSLTFCYELENGSVSVPSKFDLIYSSNLMDHLSPPSLILSALPLLKDGGLLFTSTLFKNKFASIDQYITTTFGFDCKFLPIILGVRCINHEGASYASPVAVQSCPFTTKNSDYVYHENLLMWEKSKADTLPLIFSHGQELPEVIIQALLNCVRTCAYPLIVPIKLPMIMNNLCVETAVKVLQVFVSNISFDSEHQFWKPLSGRMKVVIKPFVYCLQTQLLLHNIHLHVTVTKSDCPICLKEQLSSRIGLFSATSVIETRSTPKFMALVHKEGMDDATFLCEYAQNGGDVHIFDVVSPSSPGNESHCIQLCFYAPLSLAQQDYRVTFVMSVMPLISSHGNVTHNITDLPTQPLDSCLTPFSSFKFFQASPSVAKSALKSFGLVTSHVSDGDSSDLEISLCPEVVDILSSEKLETKCVSSNTLELLLGKFSCQLKYPYPVGYNLVQIKVSRKKGLLFVHCPRAFQDFTEEQPLFAVSPNKELSLFPLLMSQDAIASLSGQQFTKKEGDLIQSLGHDSESLPPLTKVKIAMLNFFATERPFFRLVQPSGDITAVILVNKWLYNYENRIPVTDLAFCFLDDDSKEVLLPIWSSLPSQQVRSIELNENTLEIFKRVFQYFAARTNGNCTSIRDSKSNFSILVEKNINHYFTRAVISFLLCDVDNFSHVKLAANSAKPIDEDMCSDCGKISKTLKKCSNCQRVKYCDKKCQLHHWKVHKSECKKAKPVHKDVKSKQDTRVCSSPFQPFPTSRYWYGGDFRYYYAYGNTAAEDFLENCSGITQPRILSLGCGDIRSCFYTLWKHFDSSVSQAPKQFDGVDFVLNDCSTPVQARNIVFLYLCLQLSSKVERKSYLCAMWAIWYCHELHWKHREVLDGSLRALLEHSGSIEEWSCASNPLGTLVKFTSPLVLDEISKVWKLWLERKINVNSVQQMQLARYSELQRHGVFQNLEFYAFSYSHNCTFINGDNDNPSNFMSRQPEVIAYVQTGNCFAETVLDISLPSLSTSANLTLYERTDGVYNLHYGSMPFSGYYHTVEFSPAAMKRAGVRKGLCDELLVQSEPFQFLPLLSNSVQQFIVWVKSASKVLQESLQNQSVSFTFNNLDALVFCQDMRHNDSGSSSKHQFDMIYTSNLVDHLSLPNLILWCAMLLKESGFLFTTTLLYKNFTSDIDEFIAACFGFDCKLLPILLGMRCINHEGADYASPVMIEPIPVHIGDMLQVKRHERMMVWQKVSAQSLVLPRLPQLESNNITDGLFDAFKVSVFSLLNKSGEGQSILNNQCVETAVLLLESFASSINSDVNNYLFWEPLSSVFHHKMKPYLNCLQTQLFLHQVHIHLTVSKENCPMCTDDTPFENHLGLFCSEISLPIKYMTPHFLAFIHQYASSDVHYLCKEAMSGKDVHIFDCFDGSIENKTLKLKFFAPLKFLEGGYKITIALSHMQPEKNMIVTCLPTQSLENMKIDFIHYSFSHVCPQNLENADSAFGELTSHSGNGENMQSEILLSDSAFNAYEKQKLTTKKVSSDEVQLVCGKFHFNLKCKYPIDYNGISIKFSKAQRLITIRSPRQVHNFTEEKPMFVTLPDHHLSLPPQQVKDPILICHSGMQLKARERQILDADDRDESLVTPLMSAKKNLMIFFQCSETYFSVWSPERTLLILVIVNHRLFDYRYRVPAIDLAFYTVNPFTEEAVMSCLSGMRNTRNFITNPMAYEALCKALHYFAARTNGTCRSACKPNKFEELCRHSIDRHFKRAVIYLLYRDPDKCGQEMSCQFPSDFPFKRPKVTVPAGNPNTDQKCDFCSKYHPDTRKCSNCKKVQYCSKDCQTKHWQVHSKDCKKATQKK